MISEKQIIDLKVKEIEAKMMVIYAKTSTLMILKEAIEIELINRRY